MIPLFKVYMSPNVSAPLQATLYSGWIGQGARAAQFERLLGQRFNNQQVVTLAAGTHGIHLALKLIGIKPGDSVITSPLTCVATNWPILYEGGKILWSDVQKHSLNIDPDYVEFLLKLNLNVKALIAVHWGGYPCDLERIHFLSSKYGFKIIEDAAHAFGSEYESTTIGDCFYSDFAMFSFQSIKQLTTIDGGALFVKDSELYKRAKLLRWYGINREEDRSDLRCEKDVPEWGMKYHMNDVCATIGIENFRDCWKNIDIAKRNADYYDDNLKGVPGLFQIQQEKKMHRSSYWLYTILVDNREGFIKHMTECGIHVSRVHERNDIHSCVKDFRRRDLVNLEQVIKKLIAIPVGWWITKEDREYIVDAIKKGW